MFPIKSNIQEDLIKASEGSITKFNVTSKYNKGGKLELLIGYNDLLENEYEQNIIINLTISLEGDKDELERKYSKPSLRLCTIQ